MNDQKLLLVGCGILKKEIRWLIEKNQWPVEAIFLNSALHVDFDQLGRSLTSVLSAHRERNIIVFYGCCHPHGSDTREGRNLSDCRPELCGYPPGADRVYARAFSGGVFLIEDWAQRWNEIVLKVSGNNPKGLRYIFQCHHAYLLALRTPCSKDFTTQAEQVADSVGLPLRWMDVSLDRLESILRTTIMRKMEELSCQK